MSAQNDTDETATIRGLQQLDWLHQDLEIVIVAIGLSDERRTQLSALDSRVQFVDVEATVGLAGARNRGVKQSTGEFVAFLDSGALPNTDWASRAVTQLRRSQRVGAVASKILNETGDRIDFDGSAISWFGGAYSPSEGRSASKTPGSVHSVLYGSGKGMFVRRRVFEQIGGFDERFFMFYEDVDFGWRLNLLGHQFVYEPASVVVSSSTDNPFGLTLEKQVFLHERNSLFTLYKNLGQEALDRSLAAVLALSSRRAIAASGLDSAGFDPHDISASAGGPMTVQGEAMAGLFATDQFVESLPGFDATRREIQANRVVSDQVIWKLFGNTNRPGDGGSHYTRGYSNLTHVFDLLDSPRANRVLVITGDPIGPKMAGPAIRAWHMAVELARSNDVHLVSLSGVSSVNSQFPVSHVAAGDNRTMKRLEGWADVIVFQGVAMALFKSIRDTKKILVVDIYDPMHLEQLEQARELELSAWELHVDSATDLMNQQLQRGDFFMCASERQRHFYLGQLAALGRINPANYASDPDLTGLISVVPFGLEAIPPNHESAALRNVVPGIDEDDKVLLWSGGLYNWFDPKTLIRAVGQLSKTHDDVRLFFQGTKHPHPGVPEMRIVSECRGLAKELALENKSVFFNNSWVDYSQRQNFLMEADIGVSTHHDHIETTFSFRTRILDYLWAGLPMVLTEGDHFAELVEKEGLGVVVPAEDPSALAAALEKVLYDPAFAAAARANVARVREEFYWGRVLEPLVNFVANPQPAADRVRTGDAREETTLPFRLTAGRANVSTGLRRDLELVLFHLKDGGPKALGMKIKGRLARR